MILTLAVNTPQIIGHYDGVVTIYVRQYGAGNLRLGTNREDLLNNQGIAPGAPVDGIPQSAADGIKQYFWSGDLWIISDVAGAVMILAPGQQFYIFRSGPDVAKSLPATDIEYSEVGDLSTYQLPRKRR